MRFGTIDPSLVNSMAMWGSTKYQEINIDIEYKNTTENMLSRIMQVYGSYQTIHKRGECTTYIDYTV